MKYKKLFLSIIGLVSVLSMAGQIISPVEWDIRFDKNNTTDGVVIFSAQIEKGWHLYSTDLPDGGPVPTSVHWENLKNVRLVDGITANKAPHEEVDMVYHLKLGWWTDNVVLMQKIQIENVDDYEISGYIRFMVCNDGTCQAPKNVNFSFAPEKVAQNEEKDSVAIVPVVPFSNTKEEEVMMETDYWKPIGTEKLSDARIGTLPIGYIFWGGFIGGLLALLTPCVWPMIPLTVSFFLKKHGSRRRSVIDAVLYGISIVLIYLILGIVITLIFGPSKLNELSTNATFNILFFLLLVLFAVSFFGAFDLSLPSKWTNKMDATAERTTGLLSIFFMAFTLVLVSFSCTGPIIGTLLVEAVSLGNLTGPVIGMGGFAVALAIPFALFAAFPSWLKGLPKSGGWLNSVKVVLGFIELALSLKFLSVADLAYGWGILDREVFLSLWIVIFALLGCYLLGKLRFAHDSKIEKLGVSRFFLAMVSFAFAVYMLPGLWGAPLKGISAFAPPLSTQDFNLQTSSDVLKFDNYNEGMDAAKKIGRPVLLDFSGYGCVNCRKMEVAVLDNSEVRNMMENNFVVITLMADDKKPLEKTIEVEENGGHSTLRTYGDLWSFLQRHKFGANALPYYVVLDNEGDLLSGPVYYDEDINAFTRFLKQGIDNYNKLK